MNYENKVVVVTGAASGIGRATAKIFAGYGASVIALDKNEEGVKKTAADVVAKGQKCEAMVMNVREGDAVNKTFEMIAEKYGTIDILVNVAGIAIQRPLETITEEEYDTMFDTNTKGVFRCCKAVFSIFKKNMKGKIVTVSSDNSRLGEVNNGIYCCSKSATSMMTIIMGLEWAKYGINVNAIGPGIVDTEMLDEAIVRFSKETGKSPESYRKEWIDSVPMKRLCRPEEVGELAAFLASDKADYISGVTVNIEGGSTFL